MASAGLTCPDCGSSNIVDDDLYSQPQLVCEDCGSVVSEGLLTTTRSEEVQGTDVRYSYSTFVAKQPCRNQIKGLQRLRAVCRILRLNREMEETAENFYKQAYAHQRFIRVSLEKKEVLVGCCVLVACRLSNWPIAMGTICCLMEAEPTLLGGMYPDMVKTLNIEIPTTTIMDLMEAHCQEYKVSALHVPEELSEDARTLMKRAMSLVELAADTWIVTGRQPVPIMMACVFLAWQSLRPTQCRLKYSLERFCHLAKVTKTRMAPKRVKELKEVLCKLGREIPWLRAEVTSDNVVQQVEDIVENRTALLRQALRTHEQAMLNEHGSSPEDSRPGEQTATPSLEEGAAQPSLVVGEPEAERSQIPLDTDPKTRSVVGQESKSVSPTGIVAKDSSPPDVNWGKRLLFAPPIVRHPKVRRVERPMLVVTGDEEISDSEIEMYIRTPQEMREYAATKEMLSSSEGEY